MSEVNKPDAIKYIDNRIYFIDSHGVPKVVFTDKSPDPTKWEATGGVIHTWPFSAQWIVRAVVPWMERMRLRLPWNRSKP